MRRSPASALAGLARPVGLVGLGHAAGIVVDRALGHLIEQVGLLVQLPPESTPVR